MTLDTTPYTIDFSDKQLDYLSSLHVINRIDDNLKAVSSVNIVKRGTGLIPLIKLYLELYFYDKKIDTLSFDLHNYTYDDVVHIAQHVKQYEYLLQEIDNFLAGDIVE